MNTDTYHNVIFESLKNSESQLTNYKYYKRQYHLNNFIHAKSNKIYNNSSNDHIEVNNAVFLII